MLQWYINDHKKIAALKNKYKIRTHEDSVIIGWSQTSGKFFLCNQSGKVGMSKKLT